MTIEEIQKSTEFQVFDRKSARIDAKALAVTIIAFANADGGKIALGVEDDGTLTGVDRKTDHVNELLRASFDFCVPSITTSTEYIEVTDAEGRQNHIILMSIPQSMRVHANQADEVYYRVGDKSKKLNFEQRMQLVYATIRERKGVVGHESTSSSISKSTSSISYSISEKMLRLVGVIDGEMGIRDMMEAMGMKSRPMFLNNYLTPALKAGLIERTQPDSPNSPTQKYYLTELGRGLLDNDKAKIKLNL